MSAGNRPTPDQQALPLLRLGRYRLRFRERNTDGASSLLSNRSLYLGSAWRGAFGRAFKRTVCVTGLTDCGACALLHACPYPSVFESRTPRQAKKLTRYPNTPNPFVLEPSDRRFDLGEGTLNLGITLFGSANEHFPDVAHALERAAKGGLTSRRVELDLMDIQVERQGGDNDGWEDLRQTGGDLRIRPPWQPSAPPAPSAIKVRFVSPLRIRRQGRLVGAQDFNFRAFASHLLRRISLLTYFFGDAPLETDFAGITRLAETVPVSKRDLKWRDLARHSTRQGRKVPMGGLVGSFELESTDLGPFWPYLWLGQWSHVGRGCTMGLGRYIVTPIGKDGDSDDETPSWPTPNRL